jgi:hypothetical protein
MNRLTTRNTMGVAVLKYPDQCENCNEPIYRLNDMGNGNPIEKLAEYEEAEEQGRFLKMSCKVGDTVYVLTKDFISEFEVESIELDCLEELFYRWRLIHGIVPSNQLHCGYNGFLESAIGQSVFLSKKAVEDHRLEKLWNQLADVPFNELEDGSLVLAAKWNGFDVGIDQESIWHWFDEKHSKGVGWLMNEYHCKKN